MITPSDNQPVPIPGGNGGNANLPVYGSRHFRRECRDIVRILRFQRENGEYVFSEDQVVAMLRQILVQGAEAAQEHDRRGFTGVMRVWMEAAKLEQSDRPSKHEHDHAHVHLDHDEVLERLIAEAERRDLVVPLEDGGNGQE